MEIAFVYQPPNCPEKNFVLINWKEVGHYIQGIDTETNSFKTFRKDRVLYYVDGADSMLEQPFSSPPPKVYRAENHGPEILFTGFKSADRAELEHKATQGGMKVCKSVTNGLSYLCA